MDDPGEDGALGNGNVLQEIGNKTGKRRRSDPTQWKKAKTKKMRDQGMFFLKNQCFKIFY